MPLFMCIIMLRYMIPPTGFYNNINKVCKLKKALYGLKRLLRLWYKFLSNILYKLGFHTFPYDDGAFINPNIQTVILCHVDDLIAIGPNKDIIEKIARESSKEIDLQFMGEINTFLGIDINIDRQNKILYMHQSKYTHNILIKYNKDHLYPVNTPSTGEKLLRNTGEATQGDIKLYQQQVGYLLYLALKTRPDIAFATQQCAKYASNPNNLHFKAVDRIFAYLKKYPNLGLKYNCNNILNLKGYCDSDFANCIDSRRSTTGFIFTFGDNIISWNTCLQKTVALSTCEAEYMALKEAVKEAIYLNNMIISLNKLLSLKISINIPPIMEDNNAALKLAENPEFHKRSKHIDIAYHFTREAINNNMVKIIYIPTKEQLADPLTKPVMGNKFHWWINMLQLVEYTA